jgi:hypothetical protein
MRILIEQLCPGISWQDPVFAIGGAASYFTEKQLVATKRECSSPKFCGY